MSALFFSSTLLQKMSQQENTTVGSSASDHINQLLSELGQCADDNNERQPLSTIDTNVLRETPVDEPPPSKKKSPKSANF